MLQLHIENESTTGLHWGLMVFQTNGELLQLYSSYLLLTNTGTELISQELAHRSFCELRTRGSGLI
jgi:hypothetical protein